MGQVVWIASAFAWLLAGELTALAVGSVGTTSEWSYVSREPSPDARRASVSQHCYRRQLANSCPVTRRRTGHSGGMPIRLSLNVMIPSITGARPGKASWRRRQKGGGELVHGVQVQVQFDFQVARKEGVVVEKEWWMAQPHAHHLTHLLSPPRNAKPRPMSSQAADR
ncbi:hypothetical protein MAPG_01142 [Magnaporthiopsis poae ATCC 64411]|uniref:Secreted protein n=1 Tax=Magnaporthiopsis poae (strain ATCC 64411 / 73-15) TaxID=644358 RepID=A0A0C4DMX5_MAGP6|nr:hypothetical protein MAPG_01142 [Magnaporthiopsis poae ATCC 64411]